MNHFISKLVVLALAGALQGCASAPQSVAAPSTTVKAGSLARFIAHQGFLYALNKNELVVFESVPGASPTQIGRVPVQADAETLFPYDKLLFAGTRQGMLVYSLEDPRQPALIGRAEHVVSCDPVVVQNNVAYVTLRSGSTCRQGINALLVFDVQNPTAPQEIANHPLSSPGGLGVDGNLLFVADATDGLLVIDVRDPKAPQVIAKTPEVKGYDLIPHAGVLFVSADDGLYQYRYGPEGLSGPPISKIPIGAAAPPAQIAGDPPAAAAPATRAQ